MKKPQALTKKPTEGTKYYTPSLRNDPKFDRYFWDDDHIDNHIFSSGLLFSSREDAIAMREWLLWQIAGDEKSQACAVNSSHDTERLVTVDILKRQQLGICKYGITVADNPLELREWLQHAYEECLDQAIYLKRAIQQIEKENI